MGLFRKKTPSAETTERIRNSECGQLFANNFCKFFCAGNQYFQWLIANSKYRGFKIEVLTNGVRLIRFDTSQGKPTEYGYDYDVSREGWSFGTEGYEDLPNKEYVQAFQQFLFEQITNRCPAVVVKNDKSLYIRLADNVKKVW